MLGSRELLVEVVALPAGGTGVRADAQDVWVSPRPASERVPPSARLLEVKKVRAEFNGSPSEGRREVSRKVIVSSKDGPNPPWRAAALSSPSRGGYWA